MVKLNGHRQRVCKVSPTFHVAYIKMYAVITTLNIKLFTLGGLGIVPNIAKTIALPPQRARPDGGKYFAPGKCRRSHRGRGRSDRGGHPDRHQGVRGSAHDRSNWGQRRGSLGSLPGRHTSHATGCPHCHRTPWAENCCLERLMDTGTSLEACRGVVHEMLWTYEHVFDLPKAGTTML